MAKTKIFELKNIINEQISGVIESKDIQDFLEKSMGVKKTHSSNLEDNEIEAVKKHYLHQTAKTDTFQNTSGNSGKTAAGKAEPGSVRAKAAQDGTKSMPVSQSQQTSQMKHNESGMRPIPDGGQKTAMNSNPRTAGQSGIRTAGQGQARPGNQSYSGNQASNTAGVQQHSGQTVRTGAAMRPPMDESGQRPASDGSFKTSGQGGMRQSGQGYQGNQAARSGAAMHNGQAVHGGVSAKPQSYSGNQSAHNNAVQHGGQAAHNTVQRQTGEGNFRPMGENSQRPAADGSIRTAGQNSMRQGNQGQGYRQSGNQINQRPAGNQAGQATRNTYGQRSSGEGYQRQAGEGYQRQAGEGYQRSSGQGGMRQGYQGQRSSGEGYQRNNNQTGMRQGGQQSNYGQRYQSQGNQNRQAGSDQGYTRSFSQGNRRPDGSYNQNRPRPYSQDGTRPQGGRYSGQDGQRSYNNSNQGNYQRSGQQGNNQRAAGGYNQRGFENFQKDEDDKPNYGNRSQSGNKRSPGGPRNNERKNFDQQILDQKVAEKNDYSNKRNRDRISKEKTYKDRGLVTREDFDNEEETNINKISHKKGQFIQPKPVEPEKEEIKEITIPEVLTIKELAEKMKMPSSVLIKKLFLAGKIVTVNQEITFEEASEIALEYDIIAEKEVKVNEVEELLKDTEDAPETLVKRPPVVCVMGHVDHGKTSLLDAIRQTNVTAKEAGGITQHIGAYMVDVNGEKITFLDTPGHEAFTAMRKRGAQATDIAILVVAADDGVMPQTVEAISHAKAANVQIIVAVNKIDKPSANVERVKQELTEYGLVAEDWGGDTVFAPVSAHTKEGLDHLLEMILLTAEMGELKANPNRNARGLVIEAELDKGRGPVATILVQKGTLKVGDNVAIGSAFGKVRAMTDDKGRRVKEATPSMPVEILGLNDVPGVGEIFVATDNEKEARTIAEAFISRDKVKLIDDTKAKLSLDGLFSQIKAGNIKELNLIIKADVQGSVEAMKQSLLKLSNDEVAVRILHGGVGAINESDVILASTSNAIIIGFNVKPDNAAKETADREKTDIRLYRVIYNAIDDVEAAMKGLLDPIYEERIIGHAEVRQTFKASGVGTIGGSYVLDGKVIRGCKARIYRGTSLIFDGALTSLKRFQDDVKEVAAGYECGLVLDKFNDIKEGDKAELYIMAEVPR